MKTFSVADSLFIIITIVLTQVEANELAGLIITNNAIVDHNELGRQIGNGQFKVDGAAVGAPCDASLHTTYIPPVYTATTRKQLIQAIQNLASHLEQNPTLESMSCYTFKLTGKKLFLRHNNCDGGNCACAADGPFKSTLNSTTKECDLVPPVIGDACDPTRTALLNEHLYDPFRTQLENAQSGTDVTKAVNSWITGFNHLAKFEILESDRRMACLGVGPAFDQNMECSIAGKCACVTYGKLFKYILPGKAGACKAQKGSVCYMGGIQNDQDLQPFIKADCAVSSCKGVTSVTVQKDIFLRTCGGSFNCSGCNYISTVLLASALIILTAIFRISGPPTLNETELNSHIS